MMPTVVLNPGATIFVTGVNGLIGCHVADQLLKRGYNVRGAVRDVEKSKWLLERFCGKYKDVTFELVSVPDMTSEGCYDGVVKDIAGFVHVASPISGLSDVATAVSLGTSSALNGLKACAKSPSVKRFVFTSSSLAASFARPSVECSINESTYNDEAADIADKQENPGAKDLYIYAAMKAETEKAIWKWMAETKPDFVLNTILPNANFGRVLVPEHQGFPSTVAWIRSAWTGEQLEQLAAIIPPQWFVSPVDSALLHVGALIYGEVESERLFGYAERWTWNQILAIFRKLNPERTFHADFEDDRVDLMSVPNKRAEEVLTWVKGRGWDTLEESVKELSGEWARE